MVTLDESRIRCIRNAATIGIDLPREIGRGMIEVWYQSPQEMEIDRHFAELEGSSHLRAPARSSSTASRGTGRVTPRSDLRDFLLAIMRAAAHRRVTSVYSHENPEMLGMSIDGRSMAGQLDSSTTFCC